MREAWGNGGTGLATPPSSPRSRDDLVRAAWDRWGAQRLAASPRLRQGNPAYDGAIDRFLAALAVGSVDEWKASGPEGLVVLRSTIMDPFLAAPPPASDHVRGFLGALSRACTEALRVGDAGTRTYP
jgi:hypothetical protein